MYDPKAPYLDASIIHILPGNITVAKQLVYPYDGRKRLLTDGEALTVWVVTRQSRLYNCRFTATVRSPILVGVLCDGTSDEYE